MSENISAFEDKEKYDLPLKEYLFCAKTTRETGEKTCIYLDLVFEFNVFLFYMRTKEWRKSVPSPILSTREYNFAARPNMTR